MAKKNQKENARSTKEFLFEDFFRSTFEAMSALEKQFQVTGVIEQIFGNSFVNLNNQHEVDVSREKLRNSNSWKILSRLYDYAVFGIEDDMDPMDMVIDGSDIIKLCTTENHWPSEQWQEIIAMGDGRYALEEGNSIDLYKVALLANLDIRTIKNAISANELIGFKSSELGERILVENASARRWLHGRKGFKPTVSSNAEEQSFSEIRNPISFGRFLLARKQKLGIDEKIIPIHPCVTSSSILELEAGIFSLPLDAAFPVADFYQINRKDFLACIMRVFFPDELNMLESIKGSEKC